MKDLPKHLKRAFHALEFTNAGNLSALNALLQRGNYPAVTAHARQNAAPDAGSRSNNAA